MSRDSKRLIAAVAALEILAYHCWIPVFKFGTAAGNIERFLVAATFPAVDIYFFISAYAMVSKPVDDYPGFVKNRALKLLPLFIIALAAGRFMWFIPTIMAMYLVIPPLQKICSRRPLTSFLTIMAAWAATVYVTLGLIRPDLDLGIVLFRVPSMVLGAYAVRLKEKLTLRQSLFAGALLLASGTALIYKFAYATRLNMPFKGIFYLTGIPAMLGSILLLNILAEKGIPRFVERFGGMTLELYFSQMVFGTLLINTLFRVTSSRMLVNVLTLAAIIVISAIIKKANDSLLRFFS